MKCLTLQVCLRSKRSVKGKMDYNTFLEGLSGYCELYEKGLKKQANKHIAEFVEKFSNTVSEEVQKKIIFKFLKEFCDGNNNSFKKRLDGSLPYFLHMYVLDYLEKECEKEDKMPQLRWCHEFGGEANFSMLERAYASPECDKKTVEFMLLHYTNIFFWGAHHFPESSCIEKEVYNDTIEKCQKIISEKEVVKELKEEVEYYQKLYSCYYRFEEDSRKKPFGKYCKEAGIEFEAWDTYYYNYTQG